MSKFYARKSTAIFLTATPFLILVAWFFIKVFQFRSLDVNYVDGLLALQLSRGWLEGRPFLYDTFYGFHFKLHNYYFLPLTGFITKFTGIYGFFLLYVALLSLFLARVLFWLKKQNPGKWISGWLAVLIFAIGPFAFYTYLDLTGWHPEQYFLPLMGLSAFYLARRKWLWSLVLLLLILSIKETSIVIICGLLLFASVLDLAFKNPNESWLRIVIARRNIVIVVVSVLLFAAGMFLLSHLNGSGPSRLDEAIATFLSSDSPMEFFIYLFEIIISATLIFIIGILPFVPWLKLAPKRLLILSVITGYFLILVIVFCVEGLYYYPVFHLSLPYPARVGGLWTFFLSCYIYLTVKLTENKIIANHLQREYSVWGLVLQLVFFPLLISNHRSPLPDLDHLGMNILTFIKSGSDLDSASDPDVQQLLSLAKLLPAGSEVLVPNQYMNIFHMVYPCGWQRKNLTIGRPIALIYEKALLKTSKDYSFPGKGYRTITGDNLLILVDSTLKLK